jgi:hypothetical protein
MGISVIGAGASSGGGGVSGNFVINTGDYSSDTAELSREYEAGAYAITVSPTDSTLDIYLIALDGSLAGYSNIGSITATVAFDKVVILGSTSNTSLSFSFNGESQTVATKGQLANVGAVVSSVVTSSLPSVDDTTVVNGGNFAADVEVSFIDQSSVETAAKTVVRSSSTQLIITRPDAFSPDDSPYTVKVVNPGIPVPSGSNAHLLSNSVTAGTNPVWTTGASFALLTNQAVNITLLATDTEASDVDYSIVTGTLPAGLSLDGETGVITGTAPSSASTSAVTIRAIDTGGNFLDREFTFEIVVPVSASGGTISTVDGYKYHTFTSGGTLTVSQGGQIDYLVVAGGGGSGTGSFSNNSGGGGAGGMLNGTQTISTASYSISIGTGGGEAQNGGNSSFNGITTTGGGRGSDYGSSGNTSGGSGGGGAGNAGASGIAGQGYAGGNGSGSGSQSGGGGGAGGPGLIPVGSAGGDGGPGRQWVDGNYYAGGGGGGTGTGTTAGATGVSIGYGNGKTGEGGAEAQAGIVIVRYLT